MKRRIRHRGRVIPILVGCFAAGTIAGWIFRGSETSAVGLRSDAPNVAAVIEPASPDETTADNRYPAAANTTPGVAAPAVAPAGDADVVAELRSHRLRLPIEGAKVVAMRGQFGETRGGGSRGHEAVDILALRGTPIHAVEDGRIEKLFLSKAGGNTIYQFDPSRRFCYYYAHLQRYADNLREGLTVSAGDVIGYVGTSGNAPPNTPHLHFAVFALTPARHWWEGRPIDPYLLFEG